MKKIIMVITTILVSALLMSLSIFAEPIDSDNIHNYNVYNDCNIERIIPEIFFTDISTTSESVCFHISWLDGRHKVAYWDTIHNSGHTLCVLLKYEAEACSNCGTILTDYILVAQSIIPNCTIVR